MVLFVDFDDCESNKSTITDESAVLVLHDTGSYGVLAKIKFDDGGGGKITNDGVGDLVVVTLRTCSGLLG